ncbi:hypothetical protein Clacol_000620 [Clathrus columnatus]|uniref:GPI mannosyltransferase 2 n=1 Tax=Clathrus columnatus TaxID=1419009 RepID=A0AAV4ZZS1_9AGAM|nr:hypothetical protein Clacol_000620 [Clathrus columnatus]
MGRERKTSPYLHSETQATATVFADKVESKRVRSPNSRDIRTLLLFTFCLRSLTVLIAFLSSYLPQFDASSSLLTLNAPGSFISGRFANAALKWDAIHYLHIAQEGYQYEYQFAWMPGLPVLLRILSSLGTSLSSSFLISSSICHLILSTLVSIDTTRLLYLLTLHHTESRQLALLSAYLSLLPSSPSTLHLALYTEPWYTWASYRGMFYCAQRQWSKAAFAFLFAGCFRSNAFMLGGFIFWGMIIDRWLDRKEVNTTPEIYMGFHTFDLSNDTISIPSIHWLSLVLH